MSALSRPVIVLEPSGAVAMLRAMAPGPYIAIGIGVGVAIGYALGNGLIGIALGAAVGGALYFAQQAVRTRKGR
jgi:hypothetical protein